ncbi:acetyl-CoA acetyltransferase [Nonomuraea soli]|uniref:Acetyl-CoA acetyltransferase n=1 Tax=Nonomuraea soli TaxID=1032476 RepID=A0A7W0HMT0_9ACTN|nr:acetyl-CoA acetyltransferase [Nonomuraea soli]MBA2888761.1 acetyl-CoA acetyltransferase [Nonomuraea soli]
MAAVAGIGMTALTRQSGRSVLSQAVQACREACADAGIAPGEVDGLLSYHLGDSVPVVQVARALGIERLGWHNDIWGGGTQAASILGEAAMLVSSGTARHVLIYRALNGRSGQRMNTVPTHHDDFTRRYGMAGPISMFALAATRYLHDAGLTEEHLHAVVAQSRENAAGNPRAQRREALGLGDYLAKPYVSTPLRTADCCQESDGAVALLVSGVLGGPRIRTVVRGGGPGCSAMDRAPDVTAVFSQYLAPELWERSGARPRDVDAALLYDAYSWLVPKQLTDFGITGEPGPYLMERAHAWVNPHGGLLSEGYVHGLNNVAQAVRELRGGRSLALVTGFGGSYGSAALLEMT